MFRFVWTNWIFKMYIEKSLIRYSSHGEVQCDCECFFPTQVTILRPPQTCSPFMFKSLSLPRNDYYTLYSDTDSAYFMWLRCILVQRRGFNELYLQTTIGLSISSPQMLCLKQWCTSHGDYRRVKWTNVEYVSAASCLPKQAEKLFK